MTTIDETVTIEFESKHPHNTLRISIDYPEVALPWALFDALREVGFVPDDWAGQLPPFDGRVEVVLTKRGSGLFGSWTPAERAVNERDARAVLNRFGFDDVPHHKLSAQDLL